MRIFHLGFSVLITHLVALSAQARTIMESVREGVHFNSIDMPEDARIRLTKMMIEDRKWPDFEIRGIINAGAYHKEKDPQKLIEKRVEVLKEYLLKLGVKEGNLWIQPHLLTDEMVEERNGKLEIY